LSENKICDNKKTHFNKIDFKPKAGEKLVPLPTKRRTEVTVEQAERAVKGLNRLASNCSSQCRFERHIDL